VCLSTRLWTLIHEQEQCESVCSTIRDNLIRDDNETFPCPYGCGFESDQQFNMTRHTGGSPQKIFFFFFSFENCRMEVGVCEDRWLESLTLGEENVKKHHWLNREKTDRIFSVSSRRTHWCVVVWVV
jgi:hypothetical protein